MDPESASPHHAQVADFRRRHRTGLLALVFPDIVGSTALKQQLGDKAGATLIQQHQTLLLAILIGAAGAFGTRCQGQLPGQKTYCNPVDINYQYNFEQKARGISYRSGADPVISVQPWRSAPCPWARATASPSRPSANRACPSRAVRCA